MEKEYSFYRFMCCLLGAMTVFMILMGGSSVTRGQTILVDYPFTGNSAEPTSLPAGLQATEMEISSGSIGFGSSHAGTWTGSGTPYGQGNSGWSAGSAADGKYFSFTLSTDGADHFDLTSISFLYRATGAGPSAMTVTVNGTEIISADVAENETLPFEHPLSLQGESAVEVKIIGWDNGSRQTTGGGAFRVDDIQLSGTVHHSEPIFDISPSSQQGFVYSKGEGPSLSHLFAVSGTNLEPDDAVVTITAPANFGISLDDNEFSSSVSVNADAGSVNEAVYVRLREGLEPGDYSGDVTVSGGSATSVAGTVSGMVLPENLEDFAGFPVSSGSYQSGTFEGKDGSTWSFAGARGDIMISDFTPTLQQNHESFIESGTITGGIRTLRFDYMQAFSNNVHLNVLVNGEVAATVTSDNQQGVVLNSGMITVDVPGDFVIRFEQAASPTGNQVAIDNVAWTSFDSQSITFSENPGWRMLSLPVDGITVAELGARNVIQGFSGTNVLYPEYDDANFDELDPNFYFRGPDSWVAPTDTDTPISSGTGFIWYFWDDDAGPGVPLDAFTLSVPGVSPTEDVIVGGIHEGFNLIGNPFADDLNLTGLADWGSGGAEIGTIAQVWSDETETHVTGASATGTWKLVGLGALDGDAVAPWQGFMIENRGDAGIITIPFADAGGDDAGFYKEREPKFVQLDFELEGFDSGTGIRSIDRAVSLMFHADATDEWDRFDATKLTPLSGTYATLSFIGEQNGRSVHKARESRPVDHEGRITLPMSLDTYQMDGEFTIRWEGMDALPDAWRITLNDLHRDESVDLATTSSYTFRHAGDQTIAKNSERLQMMKGIQPMEPADTTDGEGGRFKLIVDQTPLDVPDMDEELPQELHLAQNYPNPFNPVTVIGYDLPRPSQVRLAVYDMLGREVAVLVDQHQDRGRYEVNWDASRFASGVYVYRIETGGQTISRRMTLVK